MKLKKWGSLLTAISMVASMAAYVPATVSAAETEQTSISGKLANYPAVSYTIDYADATNKILTIAPATSGATYVVPNDLMYEVALSNVTVTEGDAQDGYDTVTEIAAINEIRITGKAQISNDAFVTTKGISDTDDYTTTGEGDEAVTSLSTFNFIALSTDACDKTMSTAAEIKGGLRIDCYATYDFTDADNAVKYESFYFKKVALEGEGAAVTGANVDQINTAKYTGVDAVIDGVADASKVRIEHTMKGVAGAYNHVCTNDGHKIDASFSAHDFTKANATIDTANHAHICACGKSSEDYKIEDAADGHVTNGYTFAGIHTWDVSATPKHECTVCGADDFTAHTKVYASTGANSHEIVCNVCNKKLSTAEEHNFEVAQDNNGALNYCGGSANASTKGCGYQHTAEEHVYDRAWVAQKDGSVKLEKVTDGALCACGAIETGHNCTVVKAYGHHLCACGRETEDHDFSKCYNENGDLVSAVGSYADKGVICADCGAIYDTHKALNHDATSNALGEGVTDTYCDTVKHKHYCYCGTEIVSPTHTPAMDETAHTHYCKECLAVGVVEHTYDKTYLVQKTGSSNSGVTLYELKTALQPASDSAMQLICACGAKKDHEHKYIYGVNQEHYCACGAKEATADHDFDIVESNGTDYEVCQICGYIDGHTHTYDISNECKCTNALCDAQGHAFAVKNGEHVCTKCGTTGDPEDPSTHTYIIDYDKHTHTCECGDTKDCDYVDHVCECGNTNHTKDVVKTVNGQKVHYCDEKLDDNTTTCGYVFTEEEDYGHTFATARNGNDKCTLAACQTLNPDHKHVVDTTTANETSDTAMDAVTGTDYCRCGEKIDHVLGLPDADYLTYHQCTNLEYYVDVNANGSVTIKYQDAEGNPTTKLDDAVRCGDMGKHVWTETVDGKEVTLNFCECGAMNPALLVKAGIIKATVDGTTTTYSKAHDMDDYAIKYTTDFLVKLGKAYDNVMQYNITPVYNENNTGADITLATSEEAQADALAAIDAFVAVWETQLNYQAASSADVDFVVEKDEDGNITVDHSTRGDAVVSSVYGKVGETVTIQVKAKPGYNFVGWYETETPAATDKPICETAAMEVTIKDGHFPYYAKFAENGTVNLTINPGIKYFTTITYPSFTKTVSAGTTTYNEATNMSEGSGSVVETLNDVLANEEIILMVDKVVHTDNILGITDKFGNTHSPNVCIEQYDVDPSDDKTVTVYRIKENATSSEFNAYRFTAAYDNAYTVSTYVNTTNSTVNPYYVQFQVGGKIVSGKKLPTGDVTSIKPNDPEKTGHKFVGWYFLENEADINNEMNDYEDYIEELRAVSQKIGVLRPHFIPANDLTVIVKGGTIDSDSVKEAYTYGDQILVTAELQDASGKYFSGWYDEDGNRISQKQTTWINVTKSMTITAKYDRTEQLVLEAGVDLVANRTESALVLKATRLLTDDMTLVEVGTLYTTKDVAAEDLVYTDTTLGRKYRAASECAAKNGDYEVTLTISSASASKTIAARSYVIYQDANGNNQVMYSDAVFAEPVQ